MVKILNIFKRKSQENDNLNNTHGDTKIEGKKILEKAQASLGEVEAIACKIKDHQIFSRLISFSAYYFTIIEFYKSNIENIVPVRDLMLLKYIDMIRDILLNFDEHVSTMEQREEIGNTLKTINEKLYGTIKNIKEQQTFDLNVDLKTIQDLIKMDF